MPENDRESLLLVILSRMVSTRNIKYNKYRKDSLQEIRNDDNKKERYDYDEKTVSAADQYVFVCECLNGFRQGRGRRSGRVPAAW